MKQIPVELLIEIWVSALESHPFTLNFPLFRVSKAALRNSEITFYCDMKIDTHTDQVHFHFHILYSPVLTIQIMLGLD